VCTADNCGNKHPKVCNIPVRASCCTCGSRLRDGPRWCLSQYIPAEQEAKAKQRKICPINIRGEVCTADNCGNKHPKVCNIPAHSKGKILRSTCKLWHMRVPFAGRTQGNFTGRRNGPNPPTGSKGNKSQPVRPVKLDWIVKLEIEATAKELRARIRTTQEQGRMMLQGLTYLQVAEGLCSRLVRPLPQQTR
jgi:hypothetical protein